MSDITNPKPVDASSITGPFLELFDALMNANYLSIREKELIALGIAATNQCDPCIRLHINNCLEAGATSDEILEAAGIAVVMAGGPACTNVKKIANILKVKGRKFHENK